MNKNIFQQLPILETERLIIRAFNLIDYEDYIKWNGGDIPFYMDGIHYIKDDDLDGYKRLFLKNAPRMFETKESAIWCIALKTSNKSIGKIELCKFDFLSSTAQIHYCLDEKMRRNGYMSEAMKEVLKWGFYIVNLNKIYTFIWEENIASIKTVKKYNFKHEGTLREHSAIRFKITGEEIKKNEENILLRNMHIYGCLKNEFLGEKYESKY